MQSKHVIPVAKPDITPSDAKAVADTVLSGWILQGPQVERFESLIATFTGLPYAAATSSATTAMHLGFLASGIGPGDEILVPSFSFIASANCIRHVGATPVFVDINPDTYNIDPEDTQKKITRRTKGILAVHQIGLAADMPALSAIAKHHHIRLYEDCACGLGSTIKGIHVGSWGAWGAFSFHPRKAITTAEGGMLVSKNKTFDARIRMLRAHGADTDVNARHSAKKVLTESYPLIGYNFRMSDVHASLGINQFTRMEQIVSRRQILARRYNEAFASHGRIITPFVPPKYFHTYQSYMIRIRSGASIRDNIMQYMLDRGIATRRGIMASHLEKPYRTMYPKLKIPNTEKASRETIILPMFSSLSDSDQDRVIETLLAALRFLS